MRARLVVPAAALAGAAAGLLPAAAAPAKTVQIWPLGDSITVGASAPQFSPGGYRTPLDQMLTQTGLTHHFVGSWNANSSPTLDANDEARHDGHGGYRVDQVRHDLDGIAHGPSDIGGRWLTRPGAKAALNPDVVVIHLGTNDILQRWDPRRFATKDARADFAVASQRSVFVKDLTARLSDLVLRIHALRPHAQLVVATIIPIGLPTFAQVTADYASSVRTMVGHLKARQLPTALADAYAAFSAGAPPGDHVAPGLLCNDEIHPTTAGYAVLARTFADVLEGRTLPMSASTDERP